MRFSNVIIPLMLASLSACTTGNKGKSAKEVRAEDRQTVQQALAEETSLKADRDHLAELRKDVPAETKKSNDELALQLNLMKQGKEQPHLVRDRFHSLVRDKRAAFREKVQSLREDYRKQEMRRREDFLNGAKAKRDSYTKSKRTSQETRDFFAAQEKERQKFFADERDRRQSFESEINAQSKDFESYMRERQHEFNEQLRLYSKEHSERKKEKKAVTGEVNEFKRLEEAPASALGTEN